MMGCARYFKAVTARWHVAVDSFGSGDIRRVARPEDDPRLGMTVRPPGWTSVRATRWCASRRPTPSGLPTAGQRGCLFGGSTGTVVSGAMDWLSGTGTSDLTAVAIAPDLGRALPRTPFIRPTDRSHYGKDVLAATSTFRPAVTRPPDDLEVVM